MLQSVGQSARLPKCGAIRWIAPLLPAIRRIALLFLVFFVIGCQERLHTACVNPDWGRAGRVGLSARSQPVALAVAPNGDWVALAWPTRPAADSERLHLLTLAAGGSILADLDLPPAVQRPQNLQLLVAPTNGSPTLSLLWQEAADGGFITRYLSLTPTGEIIGQPWTMLPADLAAGWYKAVYLPTGDLFLLLTTADGLATVSVDDDLVSIHSLNPQTDVINADFQVDGQGQLHLVWTERVSTTRREMRYAHLAAPNAEWGPSQLIAAFTITADGSNEIVAGPVLSLADSDLYASWIVERLTPGGAVRQLNLATWEESGETAVPQVVNLPLVFPPPTVPADLPLVVKHLARLPERVSLPAGLGSDLATAAGQGDATWLALSVQYATRSRQQFQPTLLYLDEGQVAGYQALSWTDRLSQHVVATADDQGHLYAAWQDIGREAGQYPVYLATTAPELQAAWTNLTWADYQAIGEELANRAVLGFTLLPIVALWLLVGYGWVFIVYWATGGNLRPGSRGWVLTIALLVYEGSKYLVTAQILTALPGLAYLSPLWATRLPYLAPVATLVVSSFLAWLVYFRRAGRDWSVMGGFTAVALVDFALSVAVYAMGYYE